MTEYINISSGNWYFHLIIGIILFLVFKWIIGKFILRKNLNIILSLLSTLILTPIVYYFLIISFFSILFYEYHPESKFDSIKWSKNRNDRHEMRNDLIESQILIGKTKPDLIEILGNPKSDFRINKDTLNYWTYDLGSEGHGFGLKFHYLNLNFENDKVKTAETIEYID